MWGALEACILWEGKGRGESRVGAGSLDARVCMANAPPCPSAALCDMHPMRALFLIPRNPPPRLKSKKW